MQRWIIVKYEGKLSLSLAFSYEFEEYDRVSRESWHSDNEDLAMEYMKNLAEKNNLEIDKNYHPEANFLD